MTHQTDTLAALLDEPERAAFTELVASTRGTDAQAVRWHSPTRGVLVLGICQGGELLTWFASPAANEVEAAAVQQVFLAGMRLAAATLQAHAAEAAHAADQLIKRVRH